jgi:hypothetical protein
VKRLIYAISSLGLIRTFLNRLSRNQDYSKRELGFVMRILEHHIRARAVSG